MKQLISLCLTTVVFLSLSSCGDDKEKGPAYEFKEQSAQGTIENEAWAYESGLAEVSFFEETEITVRLTAEAYEDPCAEFIIQGMRVIFDVPAEVGLYQLAFSESGYSVTLYNPSTQLNSIAVEGAVEILSISDTEVSGRIDAQADEATFANGSFTVPFCSEG